MLTSFTSETFRYAAGEGWLGRRLADLIGAPHATAPWRRHVDLGQGSTSFGLSQVGWKDYRVLDGAGGQRPAYSMMDLAELAFLYALARDRWTGAGEIVDLGPYTGLTTWCFARGVSDNPRVDSARRRERVHSYDLFVRADGSGVSILPEYLELNAPFLSDIDVRGGDILSETWPRRPIEVLFIDLAKSEAIQDHVFQQFFTCLSPGSLVVQQDYVHYYHYWIHLLMELFSEYFILEDLIYGATACYRLVKPLPDLSRWTLADAAPRAERALLHRRHIEKSPATARGALWCAHAKLLIDMGDVAGAEQALKHVKAIPEKDPVRDFRAIVPSNRASIQSLISEFHEFQ